MKEDLQPRVYPFGEPLKRLVQGDRSEKRVFVLGVYASAVHARWTNPNGKILVHALAVASEPVIFWAGSGADDVVARIKVPEAAGRLEAAAPSFNGPSGRSLDANYLGPLGVDRTSAWLCDLVPHTCLNERQVEAIAGAYTPVAKKFGLPPVTLPPVPTTFADEARMAEVLTEIRQANPEVIVLLGDQPIRHLMKSAGDPRRRLAEFGTYGQLHAIQLGGVRRQVLPLAHPRQVSGLGSHSASWRDAHAKWVTRSARGLMG